VTRSSRSRYSGVRVDRDDAVGLDEARRRRARPLVDRVDEGQIAVVQIEQSDRHQPHASLAVALADGHPAAFDSCRRGFGLTSRLADRGRDERPEDRERRDWVAGEADVGGLAGTRVGVAVGIALAHCLAPAAVESPDQHRLAGLDRDAVKQEVATLLDHAVDHVDRARRGRSGREYEVALVGRPPEQPLHLRVVVAGVRVENGLAPPSSTPAAIVVEFTS